MFQFKTLKFIPFDAIDLANREFEIPSISSQKFEWDSQKTPIFNPIWVKETGDNTYQLIDGFKVIDTIQSRSKVETIPAFVFSKDIKEWDIWQFRFKKRASEHNLPLVQVIIKCIELLLARGKEDIELRLKQVLMDLGVPTAKFKLLGVESFRTQIKLFKKFTDLNDLGHKELFYILNFDLAHLTSLAQFLSGMCLKGNKLSSLLVLLDELKKGFELGIDDILNDSEIKRITAEAPENHRYKAIKQRLIELRYPLLTEQKTAWESAIKQCKLPKGISIGCDPYFENDHLEMMIKIKEQKEVERVVHQLKKMMKSDDIQHLLDII